MANHKSAKKRARQTEKRNERNKAYMSRVRTAVKQFQSALTEAKDSEVVQGLFRDTQSLLSKAATKGLLHDNNASRRISRLAASMKDFTAGGSAAVVKKKTAKKKAKKKVAKKKTAKKKAKTSKKKR